MARLALPLALLLVLFGAGSALAATSAAQGICTDWVQVNDDAFGLDSGGSYTNEEGFEVLVFNDQLYLGMEADNSLGARLWRTKAGVTMPASQADWEEVVADASGLPFGLPNVAQNDHIDSLAAFNGYLYASTANRGNSTLGTRVFRSASGDPGSWSDALVHIDRDGDGVSEVISDTAGFGDLNNTNFKDMQVFQGWLCGSTYNLSSGAQVWCTADGTTWTQKNTNGFGDPDNFGIGSAEVFRGALYVGMQSQGAGSGEADDVGRLFRTNDLNGLPTWTEVYSGTAGSFRVDILGSLGGYLYIATRSPDGIVILRSASGDPGSWTQVNQAGMDGDADNFTAVVDGAAVYNGALYVAVANMAGGFQLWRTAGIWKEARATVDWTWVGPDGLGDPSNISSQLIPFNGYLYAWTTNYASGQQVLRANCPRAAYVILMIADGWSIKHIEATNAYIGSTPGYQSWDRYFVSTYPAGGSYDPAQAWSDFGYVMSGYTDSAAAATALYTGVKTANGRISVSANGAERLYTISEKARDLGKGAGAVTTVYISHATPAAWEAHNSSRGNGYAIADEGFWGDPNTTGTLFTSIYYGGSYGPTLPPLDVLIGAGHPNWNGSHYVNWTMRDKLAAESGQPAAFTFVERIAGSLDGGARLLAAAQNPEVARLAGLFGGTGGNLEYRLADGSGHDPENPTLAEMTTAALAVLSRNPYGFVLMIEGGAVDWASHGNNMDRMVGEMIGFNQAIQAVSDWVEDPDNDSRWDNTLVMVTGDHETGYLTAGPGVFPDQPLGAINASTLALEKPIAGSGRRASWEDTDGNSQIDSGETVYWAWNSGSHVNTLIPVYVKGAGAELVAQYATGNDPVRGPYLDNTDLFKVMDAVILAGRVICADVIAPSEVGVEDIVAVAGHWGQQVAPGSTFDLKADGVIDIVDVLQAAGQWGEFCP